MTHNDINIYNSRIINSMYVGQDTIVHLLQIHLPPRDYEEYVYGVMLCTTYGEPILDTYVDRDTAMAHYSTVCKCYKEPLLSQEIIDELVPTAHTLDILRQTILGQEDRLGRLSQAASQREERAQHDTTTTHTT